MSRLLDDQTVRRRAKRRPRTDTRGRHTPSGIADQRVRRERSPGAARVSVYLRVAVLAVAVIGLGYGVVTVSGGADSVFGRPVVPDEWGRAQADLPRPAVISPAEAPGVSFERTEDTEYVVAPGETLSEIAHRYGTDADTIADYNGLANPDTLMPGQKILIPSDDVLAQPLP